MYMAKAKGVQEGDADWVAEVDDQGSKLKLQIDTGPECDVLSLKSLSELGVK